MDVTSAAVSAGPPLVPGLTASLSEHLNRSSIAVSPSEHRIVAAMLWSDRLHIFDGSTLELERTVAGPRHTKTEFDVTPVRGQAVFTMSPYSAYSYTDVTATDDAVYALYSGRVRGQFPGKAGLADELHTFTWDGRLLSERRFSEGVSRIRVDPSGTRIYALTSAPVPTVVVYDAPRD